MVLICVAAGRGAEGGAEGLAETWKVFEGSEGGGAGGSDVFVDNEVRELVGVRDLRLSFNDRQHRRFSAIYTLSKQLRSFPHVYLQYSLLLVKDGRKDNRPNEEPLIEH